MNSMPSELDQLAKLREKTDRQLITLVENELDRALSLAETSIAVRSAGDSDRASRQFDQARKAAGEIRILLPAIRSLAPEHRACLQSRLARLDDVLHSGGVHCRPRTLSASC